MATLGALVLGVVAGAAAWALWQAAASFSAGGEITAGELYAEFVGDPVWVLRTPGLPGGAGRRHR